MVKKKLKRFIAIALSAMLCLTAVPVYAEENTNVQSEVQEDMQQENTEENITDEGSEGLDQAEDVEDGFTEEQPQAPESDSQTEENTETQLPDNTQQTEDDAETQTDNISEPVEESKETETLEVPQVQAEETEAISTPHIFYQSQIQTDGWQDEVQDGATSGTVGKSKRMETLKIRLEDQPYEGSVEYRSHVQRSGWEATWAKDGAASGTTGKGLRLEAVQIRLTGEMAEHYDIYYRVHAQQYGWLGWAKNGESAGTAAFSYRLEGIEIVLVEKGGTAPGSTEHAFWQRPTVNYQSHVQTTGWQNEVQNGAVSGTIGKSKRMESMKIYMTEQLYSGNIEYRSHIQNVGWESSWKANGALSGTIGKSLRLEAIQIRLTGNMAKYFDIYYRVHAQQYGWLGWAKNGASAGTEGCSYRLEAIQIRLVRKGAAAPGSTSRPFVKSKNGWYYENGYKYYYKSGVRQTDIRNIIGKQSSYLIKINKQISCVTVYAKDGSRGYIIPVVAFACSPGAGTPIGTFHTSNKYRWHALYGAQGQWCTRITGHILFHSLPYTHFNNRTMMPNQYNRLGTWASSGCIRLRAIDAKWIYDNCASGTTVTIYNSSAAGPLGKPVYAKIPAYQNWDPTDPTI